MMEVGCVDVDDGGTEVACVGVDDGDLRCRRGWWRCEGWRYG